MNLDEKLVARCLADRASGLSAAVLNDLKSDDSRYSLLAIFYYDIKQGGFAQFVYNANGIYLPEMAEVLSAVKADQSNAFLDQVMNLCIDKNDQYLQFLSGDFEDSPFKSELQQITQAYVDAGSPVEVEAAEAITKLVKRVG